jgi:hypothetical protein
MFHQWAVLKVGGLRKLIPSVTSVRCPIFWHSATQGSLIKKAGLTLLSFPLEDR